MREKHRQLYVLTHLLVIDSQLTGNLPKKRETIYDNEPQLCPHVHDSLLKFHS